MASVVSPFRTREQLSTAAYADQRRHYVTALSSLSSFIPSLPSLPSDIIQLISHHCPTIQSNHARLHFRFYHGHPALPSETDLQKFLFTNYFTKAVHANVRERNYMFNTPIPLAIDCGLSPHFTVKNIPLDFTEQTRMRISGFGPAAPKNPEMFSGNVFEFALASLCVEAVRYMVRVCADQLEDQADKYLAYLQVLPSKYGNAAHFANTERANQLLAQCAAEISTLKSDIAIPWVPGSNEAMGPLPEYYARQGYMKGVFEHLFCSDLNESVVQNYGELGADAFGALIKLGASINSNGPSWHQGCFDDIFPELIEAQSRLPAPPRPAYPPHAPCCGNGDSILFITLYYYQFNHAQTLIELGAYTGPDYSYHVNVLQFLTLMFLSHQREVEEKAAGERGRVKEKKLPKNWDWRVTRNHLHADCKKCQKLFKFQGWYMNRLKTAAARNAK
eukprot:TRINITY_DN4819_c0_g1_i4.p1 TRINITY_DN4819_c0_g1~~TRINITY_DN4819_c0_g1_i4.p1  ORF type:complete len:447 (-),score=84.28 TRINITY_DN4819_c0_g1_i4:20-1360(-)